MLAILKSTLLVLITLFFVGCNAAVKNKPNITYDNIENLPLNIDELVKPFNTKTMTIYNRKVIDEIVLKENKNLEDQAMLQSLELLNASKKVNNQIQINSLDETLKSLIYDSVAISVNKDILLTKELQKSFNGSKPYKVTYLLHYSKDKKLVKIANFKGGNYGKIILSKDGEKALSTGKYEVFDLKTFKVIQTFTGKEFYNSNPAYSQLAFVDFASNDNYITVTEGNDYAQILKSYVTRPMIHNINTKKILHGDYLQRKYKSEIPYFMDVSPNEKYIVENFGFMVKSAKNPKFSYSKVLNPAAVDVPLKTAWNDDYLFFKFVDILAIKTFTEHKSGVYDLKNDILLCENIEESYKYGNIKDIFWDKEDNHMYAIGSQKIYPFIFSDNQCLPMPAYLHDIKQLEDTSLKYDLFYDNDTLTVFSQGLLNSAISTAELKKYNKEDMDIALGIKKAKKLIDNGFEKRGLDILDNLVEKYYDWNGTTVLKTKKYQWAYISYLAAKQFNKRLLKAEDIDMDMVYNFRTFSAFASWYNYEDLIDELNKRFRTAVDTKKIFDNEIVKKHLIISEATYLLHKNRDEEAYNLLFNNQPYSEKSVKKYLTGITVCKTALSKDINKLAVALDIPRSELGMNSNCMIGDEHPFFFDIDGNKIFKKDLGKYKSNQSEVKEEKSSKESSYIDFDKINID